MEKKLLAILLTLSLVSSFCPASFAAEDYVSQEIIDEYYTLTEEVVETILATSDTFDSKIESADRETSLAMPNQTAYTIVGPYSNISTMPAPYIKIMSRLPRRYIFCQ